MVLPHRHSRRADASGGTRSARGLPFRSRAGGVRVRRIAGGVVRAHPIGIRRSRGEARVRVRRRGAGHRGDLDEVRAPRAGAALDAHLDLIRRAVHPVHANRTPRQRRRRQARWRTRKGRRVHNDGRAGRVRQVAIVGDRQRRRVAARRGVDVRGGDARPDRAITEVPRPGGDRSKAVERARHQHSGWRSGQTVPQAAGVSVTAVTDAVDVLPLRSTQRATLLRYRSYRWNRHVTGSRRRAPPLAVGGQSSASAKQVRCKPLSSLER